MHTKIVIVEDEVAIANMYQFKLKRSGYQVRCAYSGQEGIELIKDFLPDLVLLDLRMPAMNGDEMLQKIRSTNWGSDIRVIILTNISRDEAPASLRLLHVDRYIVKAHHTPSQVVEIVKEVLAPSENNS